MYHLYWKGICVGWLTFGLGNNVQWSVQQCLVQDYDWLRQRRYQLLLRFVVLLTDLFTL